MSKWFGKLIYSGEGIETYHEFETEEEAKAYALGVSDAKYISSCDSEDDPLEDYFSVYDQLEPVEE